MEGKGFGERKLKHFFLVLLHLTAEYRILLSPKPCSLPFYTTSAFNSYIPPTFSLENIFVYLFPVYEETNVRGGVKDTVGDRS